MARIPRPYRDAVDRVPDGVHAGHSVAALDSSVPGAEHPEGAEEEVVLFLIGMRVNRWHKVRSWLPTFVAMPRMLAELSRNPDLGLLHHHSYWSGRIMMVAQWWRSVEDLGRFARDAGRTHAPAWAAFNRNAAGTGDVGIWHETYRVPKQGVESLYGNMPAFGLGAAYGVTGREGSRRNRTHERLDSHVPEYVTR